MLISWRCKHICCREGLEKPPKAHKRKHTTTGHDVLQLGHPAHPTVTEVSAPLGASAANYIPRVTQIKRNTQPHPPELTSRLRKGGIEIVDLVNEDWRPISRTPGRTQITKKSLPRKCTQTRVSITSSKPSYSYTNMDQPDLSILTPSVKTDCGSLPPSSTPMLVQESVDRTTRSHHTLLFGSGDSVDSDLDHGIDMTGPVITNSPYRANKDTESPPPSSQPLQELEGEKKPLSPKVQNNLTLLDADHPGKQYPRVLNWGASPLHHSIFAYTTD